MKVFCWMVSNFVYMSLSYVFTAVDRSAILSVIISSITLTFISSPSVVLSRQPVMSCRIVSISAMCLRVRCIVVSFAMMWERLILTAVAMSWHFVANTHSEDFISSDVLAMVTM